MRLASGQAREAPLARCRGVAAVALLCRLASSTCAASSAAPCRLMPMPITTAVVCGVFQAVSIRMPASLPSSISTSFGHFSASLADADSGSVPMASSTPVPTARLNPASPSIGRCNTHAIEKSSALPGCATHGRPRRPRPAVCEYATRTSGAIALAGDRSRGRSFMRAIRSALVDPVSSTISIDQSCACRRTARRRARGRCASRGRSQGRGWVELGRVHVAYCSDSEPHAGVEHGLSAAPSLQ